MIDYSPKILHIGFSNPREEKASLNENCLIYRPKDVYAKINLISERIYEDFFREGNKTTILPLRTEKGPGELVRMLEGDFGVRCFTIIGGIIAPFRATSEQMFRIMQDLEENPQKYFSSTEK